MNIDFDKPDTDIFGRNPDYFTPKGPTSTVGSSPRFYKTPATCVKTPHVPTICSPTNEENK